MLSEPTLACFCDSGQSFHNCCGKFINFSQNTATPEQPMRSRYSAYVLKNEHYLLKSWHPSTRPTSLELDNDLIQWQKLKIISVFENKVHFVAYFINEKNHTFSLYEQSEFINDEQWFYLAGQELKTSELTKNMLCPCRSGKKFKRCCEKILSL